MAAGGVAGASSGSGAAGSSGVSASAAGSDRSAGSGNAPSPVGYGGSSGGGGGPAGHGGPGGPAGGGPIGPVGSIGSGPKRTVLRPPPWDKAAEADSGSSFGTWLRRQREAREISLREIAERTKISMRYLQAMEDDRFEVLPAPVFAKGFLREYARYVGLSPDDVVNHYLSVQQPQAHVESDAGRRERRSLASWPRWLPLLLATALLLGLAALLALLSDRWRQHRAGAAESRPPIVAPLATPVPPAPAVPAAPPSAPLEVTVDFNQECWVEAVVDGGSRRAEMREQGESMQIEARQSVVFAKLGNAAAVDIQVNGYPYPLDKQPGDVIRNLKIDLDTVRALKAKKEGH
jgi:cytoskeleton protein RodZ